MTEAKFITIEGGEGVGKTTCIRFIEDLLVKHGVQYCLTREPGGTPLAEEIRKVLLEKRDETVFAEAELLLMFAARVQHVETKIKPALEQGVWVICDRFTDATFAYQGGGRQINWERIKELEYWALGDFKADKTILLDVAPEIGMERASKRGELDRFESEHFAFFHRVRDAYHLRVEEDPERFLQVDASKSLTDVQHQIAHLLGEFIEQVKQTS